MNDIKIFAADYWLRHGLDHLSPTQLNKSLDNWFFEYVYKDQQWRRNKKPSSKMFAGISAQIGWDNYALFDKSKDESIDIAVEDYKKYKSQFIGDEKEMKQFEINLEDIPAVVKNYIQALDDLEIKKFATINSERNVDKWFDGIEVPITGKTDMETETFFIEAKTKWKRKSGKARKDGTFNYANIAAPTKPDPNHVKQISFYQEATKKPGYLIYATPSNYIIFNTKESEELAPHILESCLNNYKKTALVRQNLLKFSEDPKEIAKNFIELDTTNINYYSYTDEELKEVRQFYE